MSVKAPKVILASGSPRRKEIMKKMDLEFEVVPSGYEEDMALPLRPVALVKELAKGKAADVAKRFPDALVIGADTVVVAHGKVLGKPHTQEAARDMLRALSGTTHEVVTGLALVCVERQYNVEEAVSTKIVFKTLSEPDIEKYIESGEPLDKAGAYAVQGLGGELIEKIEGDYWSTVGLPANLLAKHLRTLGISVRDL